MILKVTEGHQQRCQSTLCIRLHTSRP